MNKKVWELLEKGEYEKLDQMIENAQIRPLHLIIRARVEMLSRAGKIHELREYLNGIITRTKDRGITHIANAHLIRVNCILREIRKSDKEEILREIKIAETCDCDIQEIVRAEMYHTYGDFEYYIMADYNKAVSSYNTSINLYTDLGYLHDVFYLRNRMAIMYRENGLLSQTYLILNENLILARKINSKRAEMITLGNIASLRFEQGHINEAEETFTAILQKISPEDDRYNHGIVHMKLGLISRIKGEDDSSLKHFELADKQLVEFPELRAEVLIHMAMGNFKKGIVNDAKIQLELAHLISRKGGFMTPLAIATYLNVRQQFEEGEISKDMIDLVDTINVAGNKRVEMYKNLTKALIQFNEKRSFKKILALKYLDRNRALAGTDVFASIESTILALRVLILEYSLTESPDTLGEIKNYMSQLFTIAYNNDVPDLQIMIQILSLKLELGSVSERDYVMELEELRKKTTNPQILSDIDDLEDELLNRYKMQNALEGSKFIKNLKRNEVVEYLKYIADKNLQNLYIDSSA